MPAGALLLHLERLFGLATAEGIPTVCNFVAHVELGCLMSYSTNVRESVRQAGRMLGRVLLGANPAEMPVEQPTNFELSINLKTANALGITVRRQSSREQIG